jgi:hypothetical protein
MCPTIALLSFTTNQFPIGGIFSTASLRLYVEFRNMWSGSEKGLGNGPFIGIELHIIIKDYRADLWRSSPARWW